MTLHSTLSFMDYKPLEILIKKFKLKEVEEELKQYKRELLQQFMKESTPESGPLSQKRKREESEP